MKSQELQYILAIARAGTISRAAEELFITQPALSRALASVETDFGSPLFERHGRQMTPTAVGSVYLKYAERILETEKQMNTQLQEILKKHTDDVRIAVPMYFTSLISNCVFTEFNQKFPSVPVSINIAGSSEISNEIANGSSPLGLAVLKDNLSDLFAYNIVGQVEMVVVVSSDHPLLRQAVPVEGRRYPCVTFEQIQSYPFARSADHQRSSVLSSAYFARHNAKPNIVCRVAYTGYLYTAAATGSCIALAPDLPIPKDGSDFPSVRYLCLRDTCQMDTLAVIRCHEHILSDYEKELIGMIRRLFQHDVL